MFKTILCCLLLAAPLSAQWPAISRDSLLESRLLALADSVDGEVGIYVRHLESNRGVAIRADEIFPTASMIKVPILLTVFDQIESGRLRYDTALVWTDSLRYLGEDDLFDKLQDSARVPLNQITLAMITTSDNAASLWLQGLVGGGVVINEWLSQHGFDSTRMNSRTPGRREIWQRYGWGQTTPREIAEMMVGIRQGKLMSAAASEAMYRHLTRIHWNGIALSELPPWVQAASKQGFVRSRSEVVPVNAPSGDYVFAVITRNQRDTTNEPHNQGWQLIRQVSALLWDTFEPGHPYDPPADDRRYLP